LVNKPLKLNNISEAIKDADEIVCSWLLVSPHWVKSFKNVLRMKAMESFGMVVVHLEKTIILIIKLKIYMREEWNHIKSNINSLFNVR